MAVAIRCAVIGVGHPVALGQNSKPTEYEVKATYLYKFGRFVEWPTKVEGDSFSICVLGQDPFGPALNAIIANEERSGEANPRTSGRGELPGSIHRFVGEHTIESDSYYAARCECPDGQ
jgi:uncharacterized protein DUF4154